MKRVLAIVAALALLNATPLVLGAETPTSPEKTPSPPRTPQTGVDPGIQVDPGPSPDPRTAVPPKSNPDPGMAINPDVSPVPGPSATASLRGQVLKIEPDSLILSTAGDGQVRLKLETNTKIEGSPKVGDTVEVELSPEKRIVSVRVIH